MEEADIKGNLIHQLADAFVSEEDLKKDSESSRFNKATGTLRAENTFINYALSHIDDTDFTKGKVYKCSQIHEDYTSIISDSGKEIKVNINDPDFSFKINPRKTDM